MRFELARTEIGSLRGISKTLDKLSDRETK